MSKTRRQCKYCEIDVNIRISLLSESGNDTPRKIIGRSNIVQYDDMGYPLRLCIMDDGEQIWLDSYGEETDLVCKWKFVGDK